MRYRLGDRRLDSIEPRDTFLDYDDDDGIEEAWDDLEVARMNFDYDEIKKLKKRLTDLGESVDDEPEDEPEEDEDGEE